MGVSLSKTLKVKKSPAYNPPKAYNTILRVLYLRFLEFMV